MTNRAYQFVVGLGMTIESARCHWRGCCIEFAGELIDALKTGRLAYFELPNHPFWKYHAAVEIDGHIHDLWSDEPTLTAHYAESLGASEISYPAEDPCL